MTPTRIATLTAFVVVPALVLSLVIVREIQLDDVGVDFTDSYYPAAELLLEGESPYAESSERLPDRAAYVYPPLTAVIVAPFTLLPARAAGLLWTGLVLVALGATLAVLGVRDWRLYGLVLLWPAALSAIQTASLTLILGLLGALVWRYRDRTVAAGVFLGLAIALKLFPWPLVVWLLATQRYASAAIATGAAGLSTLSVLAFMPLSDYFDLLRQLSDLAGQDSYTLSAFLLELGIAEQPSRIAQVVCGGLLLLLGRKSFVLCMAAALLIAPLAWLHYFALLAIPLAVVSAPLWAWTIPLAMWAVPGGSQNGAAWQIALALTAVATTIAVSERLNRSSRKPA